MGSYCDLNFSNKNILNAKSAVPPEVMSLFISSDKYYSQEKYSDIYPDDCDGEDDSLYELCLYKTTVKIAKKRLDILGFNLDRCDKALENSVNEELDRYKRYIEEYDDCSLTAHYKEHVEALSGATCIKFVEAFKTIFKKIEHLFELEDKLENSTGLIKYLAQNNDEYALFLPITDIRLSFRILLECFSDDEIIKLDVSHLIGDGYYSFEDDLVNISKQELTQNYQYDSKIIILTEGSSDKFILEKSFNILYPEYAPFYSFMDFDIAKAAGGASTLVSVIKAIIGAGFSNRIIALFDNDTAANVALKALKQISIPTKIRILSYPNFPYLDEYPTIGPSGKSVQNVNGLAGSIELYLSNQALLVSGELSPVQWKGYDKSLKCYQGEVLDKTQVAKQFYEILDKVHNSPELKDNYDWQGLDLIFQKIFNAFN